jgi:predicted transcriptional regulator
MSSKHKIRITSQEVFEEILGMIHISAIMTPWDAIAFCKPNDPLKETIALMKNRRFDCMPVLEESDTQNGEFTSYITLAKSIAKDCFDFMYCRDVSLPIEDMDKIDENLQIRELIEGTPFQNERSKLPLFLTNKDKNITGLITSADLDKVASRMYFYILFSELEHSLLTIIAEDFQRFREVCSCNNCKSKRNQRKRGNNRQSDEGLDEYHYLFLIEILHMVKEGPTLSKSHEKIKELLRTETCKELSDFRNYIMHPKPIVTEKYPICKLADIQNLAYQILAITKNEQ